MLGGLCMTRKACRPMDDESPDDASGIVSNFSIKVMRMRCARYAQWWCVAGRLGVTRALTYPACRLADMTRVVSSFDLPCPLLSYISLHLQKHGRTFFPYFLQDPAFTF